MFDNHKNDRKYIEVKKDRERQRERIEREKLNSKLKSLDGKKLLHN